MNTDRGFTLLEIMVVVAIMAILLTILVTAAGPMRRRGEERTNRADLLALSAAIDSYSDKHGTPRDPDGDILGSGDIGELISRLQSWEFISEQQASKMSKRYGTGGERRMMYYVQKKAYLLSPLTKYDGLDPIFPKRYQLWHIGPDGRTNPDVAHPDNVDDWVVVPSGEVVQGWQGAR